MDILKHLGKTPNPSDGIQEVASNAYALINRSMHKQIVKGLDKYKGKLKIFNGRSAIADASEELADLTMYFTQLSLEYTVMTALVIHMLNGMEINENSVAIQQILNTMPIETAQELLLELGII